ncbi:hypothetical protein F0M18_17275 [Pseudohalioglobus sediminis]|uniref:Serine kinase n=1 Tax=Pseudohalioglobus sediminis TaxID=2606449 RepID=A0A5B0WPE4_9GAMM|nr:hypothetical protein [Pseudohalioglobus sediminis]KAA1188954.1 hypothetical protein F0M18_17275 [Pseudohalioglobus sediminis]
MAEQVLYGVPVRTGFELFAAASAMAGFTEQAPLQLRELPAQQPLPTLPETFSLYHAHNRDLSLQSDRALAHSVAGQSWRMDVNDVVSFHWRGGDNLVHYQCHALGTQERLVFWFVHIFLPLYLTLERGHDFLHAAAVEVASRPVLFVAPSTGGKSTLADYFLQQGHPLLSDDKVATVMHGGQYYAVPSHPHHRPWREYEVLGDRVQNFATRARPIHAVYLLEQGEPDAEIAITEVTGFRKFEELIPNYLYSFRFLQEQRMRWLAQLADSIPVYRVHRPWNLERMDAVYRALRDHAAGVGEGCASGPLRGQTGSSGPE